MPSRMRPHIQAETLKAVAPQPLAVNTEAFAAQVSEGRKARECRSGSRTDKAPGADVCEEADVCPEAAPNLRTTPNLEGWVSVLWRVAQGVGSTRGRPRGWSTAGSKSAQPQFHAKRDLRRCRPLQASSRQGVPKQLHGKSPPRGWKCRGSFRRAPGSWDSAAQVAETCGDMTMSASSLLRTLFAGSSTNPGARRYLLRQLLEARRTPPTRGYFRASVSEHLVSSALSYGGSAWPLRERERCAGNLPHREPPPGRHWRGTRGAGQLCSKLGRFGPRCFELGASSAEVDQAQVLRFRATFVRRRPKFSRVW